MRVLSLIELPTAVPLGAFTGQTGDGSRAVLSELNATWRNSGTGVIFGQDTFGQRFAAFSQMVQVQTDAICNTVLRTIEAVHCPNKVQEITDRDGLAYVPACMYIPILTMPEARSLFEAGQIRGWDVPASALPQEDVVGRLLKNGTYDTGDQDYDREAPVTYTVASGDPDFDQEELRKIRTTREFISSFIEEQLGDEGENIDFTDLSAQMGKLIE